MNDPNHSAASHSAASHSAFNHAEHRATRRILDANANRACEGLRVVEDFARFALDDRFLAGICKEIRHELAAILGSIDGLVEARDSEHDVGRSITAPGEHKRESMLHVAVASGKRCEQALRCLEEFSKPEFPQLALRFEQLRYRVYALNGTAIRCEQSRRELEGCHLYVLLGHKKSLAELQSLAEGLIHAGVDILQLRMKDASDREFLERALLLKRLTNGSRTKFIVNDRVDMAVLCDADGVHLGQDDLPLTQARKLLAPGKWIGVSTHCLEDARRAEMDGADYIGCGPTFSSRTKNFSELAGLEFLRAIQGEIGLPAFAIGGIDSENIGAVASTGFCRVAVGNAVTASSDPSGELRKLRTAIMSAARLP